MTSSKIAVIGGGIAGCSAAYALQKKGLNVTLYEPGDQLAGETSGNPLAVMEPRLVRRQDPASEFFVKAWRYSIALYDHLHAAMGNIWHRNRGSLFMPGDEEEKARMQELANAFPDIASFDPDQGLAYPNAGCLFTQNLCQALTENVTVKLGAPTTLPKGYDAIVLANGLSAFDAFGKNPMRPNRGQINYLPALENTPLKHVISFDGGYLTPATEIEEFGRGHILGASFENWDDARDESWQTLSAEDLDQNLDALSKVRPDLASAWQEAPLQGRVGLRATTMDHMPLVGPAFDAKKVKEVFKARQKLHHSQRVVKDEADIPGLYILSGFASRGFTAAPLAAEVLAAQITGTPGPCQNSIIQALRPCRFLLKKLKSS